MTKIHASRSRVLGPAERASRASVVSCVSCVGLGVRSRVLNPPKKPEPCNLASFTRLRGFAGLQGAGLFGVLGLLALGFCRDSRVCYQKQAAFRLSYPEP